MVSAHDKNNIQLMNVIKPTGVKIMFGFLCDCSVDTLAWFGHNVDSLVLCIVFEGFGDNRLKDPASVSAGGEKEWGRVPEKPRDNKSTKLCIYQTHLSDPRFNSKHKTDALI